MQEQDDNPNGHRLESEAETATRVHSAEELVDDSTLHLDPSQRAGPIPKRIGNYHIKRVIASGGMGTVYEAMQDHPRRPVAVKIMKLGLTSPTAMRRFEYESQTLGRLRHPGIAEIYEAGMHDDGEGGLPFFAMEFIAGANDLLEYANGTKLDTRARLRLFIRVCEAIHHGHQKGIIHRDLKPANILVDTLGNPKIIDFGVARATNTDAAITLQTDVGQLIGTVQYMSPEQIDADPHDIDTRSDVYALGMVLYTLLAKQLPYDVSGTVIYEATRMIRERQPRRLSTIDRSLKGDLETIVLHALEKDRDRRYQSALQLAEDIERFLDCRTILARPPSTAYQLRTFVRRNRPLVGGLAAAFIGLIAGITAIAIERQEAIEQRERAVRRFEQVRELAHVFMFDFHDAIQELDGALEAREMIVTHALRYLDTLAAEHDDNVDLTLELARAYDRVGDIRGGSRNPADADTEGALDNYRSAMALREEVLASLVEEDPMRASIEFEISNGLIREGDILRRTGDVARALEVFREALVVHERLAGSAVANHDFDVQRGLTLALNAVGDLELHLGHLHEAERIYRRSLQARRRRARSRPDDQLIQRDVSVAHISLGRILAETGLHDAALSQYQSAVEIREAILEENILAARPTGRARRDLAFGRYYCAVALIDLRRPSEALTHATEMLATCEARAAGNSGSARASRDLAVAHEIVGRTAVMLEDLQTAALHFKSFAERIASLAKRFPENLQYGKLAARSERRLGELAAARGEIALATAHLSRSQAGFEGLTVADPNDVSLLAELAITRRLLGVALTAEQVPARLIEGRDLLLTARRTLAELRAAQPENAGLRQESAATLEALAEVMRAMNDVDSAAKYAQEALAASSKPNPR